MTILVAGASGMLGRHIVRIAHQSGYRVRTLSRSAVPIPFADEPFRGDILDPASLAECCNGVEMIISCAGASMSMGRLLDRRSFMAVDLNGNRNLLTAARNAGVRKFVYISVAGAASLPHLEYTAAHLRFEEELQRSGMGYSIIRPTGFFGFLRPILAMARKGRGVVIGDGTNRTNPVDERDVAEAAVEALTTDRHIIEAGGPEVFTRRGLVELAMRMAGAKGTIHSVPAGLFRTAVLPMKLVNPRLHALMEFGAAVSTTDAVTETYGQRKLEMYFTELLKG